jgi:predicted Rossmann fold nucleotide-binding protein DprA/Smf involved in DNA uptake
VTAHSTNEQAVLLACSGLALARGGAASPLGPKEWSSVTDRARGAKLAPGELVSMSVPDLESGLRITPEMADRLGALFARHGQLTMELERLGRLGIWVMTTSSPDYPERLRERLGAARPPVLFGLGERSLLEADALAVVGSRDVDREGLTFARELGESAARQRWLLVSGAARGVDAEAMRGAFDAGGRVIGIPSDGLERYLRDASLRLAFSEGQAVYVNPYRPDAPFSVGNAMARNKLVYCLARLAVVVDSTAGSGGTWAGAVEALAKRWVPVMARVAAGAGGNAELIRRGALPIGEARVDLASLTEQGDFEAGSQPEPATKPIQETLF